MIAALLLATLFSPQATAAADPLAPAREGKLRCIAPNPAKLTCQSIVRYKAGSDGSFDATVIGIVSRDPMVLIRYQTFGRIEEGGVCVMVRTSDFERGTLLSEGRPLAPNADSAMHLQIQGTVQPLLGKKRCYQDLTEDGVTRAMVTLDGVAHPELSHNVMWITPSQGYAVGL